MLDHYPSFSLIIPTYARPSQLAACLTAVTQLDYPRTQFEVLVVDDGSPHAVDGIVDACRPAVNISLIKQSNAGPARARNQAAARAQGRFLAFTDDDCAPYPDWLRVLANDLAQHPECLVGGYTVNALPQNLYAEASQMLITYLYHYNLLKAGQPPFLTSNNFALSARLFQELGGFDTTFPLAAGEDRDFCDRWLQAGRPLRYIPRARIKHYQALNAHSFWRQHFRYGRGNYHYYQRRSARGSGWDRLEPWRFYAGLSTTPWKEQGGLKAGFLSILLLLSQIANASGYASARAAAWESATRPKENVL